MFVHYLFALQFIVGHGVLCRFVYSHSLISPLPHDDRLFVMDPLAGLEDSSTEEDAASNTTEDDPQIPENQQPQPSSVAPLPHPAAPVPPVTSSGRAKPHYELKHTIRGHTKSLSAIKFSPDGTILASCGMDLPF